MEKAIAILVSMSLVMLSSKHKALIKKRKTPHHLD